MAVSGLRRGSHGQGFVNIFRVVQGGGGGGGGASVGMRCR